MSDMRTNSNKKRTFITLAIGIVALSIVTLSGLWYFSMWPFSKSDGANVKSKEYFVFEVNDGIEKHKAAEALKKLGSITEENLDGFEWKMIEKMKKNLESTDVTFTNKENIGFVYVFARFLKEDKEITDLLAEYEIKEKDEKSSVLNVIKELACQIKLADVKGKVSLKEYNESLYALAPLKAKKEEHGKLNTDLAQKTACEFGLLSEYIESMLVKDCDNTKMMAIFDEKKVAKLFPGKK